jgi:DNA gyrase subunit B
MTDFDLTMSSVRKRPMMYVWSTDDNGMTGMIFLFIEEILLNAETKDIQIEILPDDTVKVVCGSYDASHAFSSERWLPVVVGLSEFFEWNDPQRSLRTERGVYIFDRPGKEALSGIDVIFKPDIEIFHDVSLDYYRILDKLTELAALNPSYHITLTDAENKNVIQIPRGVESLLKVARCYRNDNIRLAFSVPEVQLDAIISFSYFKPETQISFVNSFKTREGGTHVTGMLKGVRMALTRFLNQYLLEKNDIDYTGYMRQMNYVVSVKLDEPVFLGSAKCKLGNTEITKIIASHVEELLYAKFEENPRLVTSQYPGIGWSLVQEV